MHAIRRLEKKAACIRFGYNGNSAEKMVRMMKLGEYVKDARGFSENIFFKKKLQVQFAKITYNCVHMTKNSCPLL